MNMDLAVAAVAAGALAQGVTGIGFALVCAPFLVALAGPREGVRIALLLSAGVNVLMLAREHRGVRVGDGLALLVPAALVTPVLAVVVRRADTGVLAVAAGSLAVAAAVALAAGLRLAWAAGRLGAVLAGLASGAMNVLAGISGPVVAAYAENAGWAAEETRPTLQAYFLALNAVALASLGVPRPAPALVAGLAGGWLAGVPLARRLPERAARGATLALAAAGGVAALLRGLS